MKNLEDYCIDKGAEDGWHYRPFSPPVGNKVCEEMTLAYTSAYWEALLAASGCWVSDVSVRRTPQKIWPLQSYEK